MHVTLFGSGFVRSRYALAQVHSTDYSYRMLRMCPYFLRKVPAVIETI